MPAIHEVSPNADVISKHYALTTNITAAKSLASILSTNLGPKGTLKMLVGGAGQIKLTKDGYVLLSEMQIQHPTAALIARTASAQDSVTGDGTTSTVLLTGDLMRQCERYVAEGLHPRALMDGIDLAQAETMKFLDSIREKNEIAEGTEFTRDQLCQVARTSLRTKLQGEMAEHLTEIVVDAILCVSKPGKPIDLHMVEMMTMQHKSMLDTRLVKGLVLDHGTRHPHMKKNAEKCHILTANFNLEWEKTEINSGFFYKTAEEREAMVDAEQATTRKRVAKIVALKNEVCKEDETLVVINQQGIDPYSLDGLQREGIMGIRRAKRRNMERLALACGGYSVNSVDDISPECLGYAGRVYEHMLGEDKFTFIEDVKNPFSCTILIRGPDKHSTVQIKDAIRDGLRAVKNAIDDRALIPGAGAFEISAYNHLTKNFKSKCRGKSAIGVQAFADALLTIPKTLARNAGHDTQECMLNVTEEPTFDCSVGVDLATGGPCAPAALGIWDNYRVKRQLIQLSALITTKLLMVDEIMRAGRSMKKG